MLTLDRPSIGVAGTQTTSESLWGNLRQGRLEVGYSGLVPFGLFRDSTLSEALEI